MLYAIVLDWPGEEMIIRSLSTNLRLYSGQIDSVRLLGSDDRIEWSHNETGLRMKMPSRKPCDYAFTLRITIRNNK